MTAAQILGRFKLILEPTRDYPNPRATPDRLNVNCNHTPTATDMCT